MVKLTTLVGRLSDGIPLAQTPTYLIEEDEAPPFYKEEGELLLEVISRGTALPHSRLMTILIDDRHCFHCLIGDTVCYITLCEFPYPQKLAFHYLQDLKNEFESLIDQKMVELVSSPFAFERFDYVIGNIRRRYLDTRTQANLNKLISNHQFDHGIVTEEFSKFIGRVKSPGFEETASCSNLQKESILWSSDLLEKIALKWMPITVSAIAVALFLRTSIVLSEHSFVT